MEVSRLVMDMRNLNTGWPALVSLVVGFGTMVPFMNTALLVGPGPPRRWTGRTSPSTWAFTVAFCVYLALRRFEDPNAMAPGDLSNGCSNVAIGESPSS